MGNIKYIIGGIFSVIAIVVVLMFAGVIPGIRTLNKATITKVDLLIWDVGDDKGAYEELIKAFKKISPGATITYVRKSEETYKDDLLRAFATGEGPDIFSIHHTEAIQYGNLLSPAPATVFSAADFRSSFVDVAQKDFLFNENVFAAPLYVDTLALYYNTDLFNSAGIVFPPATWEEFEKNSRVLTQRRQSGDIIISGAALGGGKNVVSSSDILAALMLQNGATMVNEVGKMNLRMGTGAATNAIEKAIEFFTSFAKQTSPNYSWSGSAAQTSEDMFAQGKAAMMIGYASARNRIMKKSPRLRFSVAPLPQPASAVIKKNYADYRGLAVYKNSQNKDAAWQFIQFLTLPENQKYYATVMQTAGSRRSVIAEQQQDPNVEVFADQALSATSWLQLDHEVIGDVFTEMIEMQISGDQSVKQTIENGERKINALMKTL